MNNAAGSLRRAGVWFGALALATCAWGQGCPPGVYQYGPATWDLEIEQIVVDHYGLGGPLTPTAEDYERAERDVGLIRLAIPGLETHVGQWEHRVLLVETDSLTTIPNLTCTNTHFQAQMMPAGFGQWWIVEFPRGMNILAVGEVYAALPEVLHAEPNALGGTSCTTFDTWSYGPRANGTWLWTILDSDACGPGIGACCTTLWAVEVSSRGTVHVLCIPPDCNGDGHLTIHDFGCFQSRYAAGDPWADCNKDGSLTVADFGCYQTKWVGGCS
ncbi:MAG: GC-type dockerin domain-anchored protein [Phycisphaerales bacterium]